MNSKTLTEIDFYRIRDEVAKYCISEEGKNYFISREPSSKPKEIEKLKNLSREWLKYISASHKNPITYWEPVNGLLAIIKTTGTSLTLEQVKALGQFVLSVKNVSETVSFHAEDLELKLLPQQIELLPDMSETERLIFRVIDSNGELKDLPEIAAIRKQIASLNTKIKTIMFTLIHLPLRLHETKPIPCLF